MKTGWTPWNIPQTGRINGRCFHIKQKDGLRCLQTVNGEERSCYDTSLAPLWQYCAPGAGKHRGSFGKKMYECKHTHSHIPGIYAPILIVETHTQTMLSLLQFLSLWKHQNYGKNCWTQKKIFGRMVGKQLLV